jgi:hypothetical protein
MPRQDIPLKLDGILVGQTRLLARPEEQKEVIDN